VNSHRRDFRIALRGVDHRECRENFAADFVLFVGQFPKYDAEDATKAAPVSHAALVGKDVSRIVDYIFVVSRPQFGQCFKCGAGSGGLGGGVP